MKRLFVALPLPAETRLLLVREVALAHRRIEGAKWVATENLHVTLKFLGNTPDNQVGEIGDMMRAAAAGIPELALELVGVGAFPNLQRARVLWTGLTGDVGPLRSLAATLDQNLAPLGFEPERRPFAAHVTLARARGKERLKRLDRLLEPLLDKRFARFRGTEVVLFESHLSPSGPRYERVLSAEFKSH